MKSSNLAERLDPEEEVQEQESPAPQSQEAPVPAAREVLRAPRPRRSLQSRSIVIRDQGFTPFRVS